MAMINGLEGYQEIDIMSRLVTTSNLVSDLSLPFITVFFCKSGKAMPYISKPYRKRGFLERIRASLINIPITETGDKKIDLAPWPESVSSEGVVTFTENGRPEADTMRNIVCKPDFVVFATGYLPTFTFLEESYGTPFEADRRGIWRSGNESVGFIGFVRPAIGAIPPCRLTPLFSLYRCWM